MKKDNNNTIDNSENMKTKILLCFAIFTQDEKTLAPGHFAVSSGGGFFNDKAKDVDRVEQLQRSWSRILQIFLSRQQECLLIRFSV